MQLQFLYSISWGVIQTKNFVVNSILAELAVTNTLAVGLLHTNAEGILVCHEIQLCCVILALTGDILTYRLAVFTEIKK